MAAKPSIPKGTRDFSPVEMAKRNYIFNTIRDVYHLYGFQQIETPSMEMLSTLMGKYGDEGDKLLFKIQNSGDYFSGITDEELLSRNAAKLASKFCEKGLRYDLIHTMENMAVFLMNGFFISFINRLIYRFCIAKTIHQKDNFCFFYFLFFVHRFFGIFYLCFSWFSIGFFYCL